MKYSIEVIFIFIILSIFGNISYIESEEKVSMKNITVHIITKLEITKVEYVFISNVVKEASLVYIESLEERFLKAVIESKRCNGKIDWEIANTEKIGYGILPIDSYSRTLSGINSFLRYIDKQDRESYHERALLISSYYSNKFARLKRNDSNYNYIGEICDMWSSIYDNIGERIRMNKENNRFNDYLSLKHLPLKKFTHKCFPNQQSVNQYKENFKKQEFSDPDKCYAIVSQEKGVFDKYIGINETLVNGSYESTLIGGLVLRQSTWRLVKSGFNSIYNQTQYKIQNCDSDEFLTMNFKSDTRVLVSKNPNIDEDKRNISTTNWLIIPFSDGESHIIKSTLNPYTSGLVRNGSQYDIVLASMIRYCVKQPLVPMMVLFISEPNTDLWKFELANTFPDKNNCYIINNKLVGKVCKIKKYCKIRKASTNESNSSRLKCILQPMLVKNDRSISWRFIRTLFDEYDRKSIFKIQNCESNEYLVINNSLVDNSTLKYAFTMSTEGLLRVENEVNSLWIIDNFRSIYSNNIIDAETRRYFLCLGENAGQNEHFIHAIKQNLRYDFAHDKVWEFEKTCV